MERGGKWGASEVVHQENSGGGGGWAARAR